jgi:hypothetical protein
MANDIEITIIVEGFTYAEVGGFARFRLSLDSAVRMQQETPGREILLLDTSGLPELAELLNEYPSVTRVEAIGEGYDEAKIHAASLAQGEYLLYLDGDCIPAPRWLDYHMGPLRSGEARATGGFTRYDGGFLASVSTIMDFGFLIPRKRRPLACYAFNNSGFLRSVMIGCPAPIGKLRCNCYAHAQSLIRSGAPVLMVPDARVLHAVQPFFVERFRQGYDAVGACWVNPTLPERRLLALGPLAAPLFFANCVRLDWRRVLGGYRDLEIPTFAVPFAMLLFPLFRLVDFAGMVWALASHRGRSAGKLAREPRTE